MNFYGYKRPDGRVGVRNKVLILPASVCASDTTRIISQQVVGESSLRLSCDCDRARIERVLISLGAQQLGEMIEQDGGAEVCCHFCRRRYAFTAEELRTLLERAVSA